MKNITAIASKIYLKLKLGLFLGSKKFWVLNPFGLIL